MKTINKVFLAIIFLLTCSNLISQPSYQDKAPDSKYSDNIVYLHTDRNYYLPGESIMFKAYILDYSNNNSNAVNDTLHVFLLDQEGLEVATGYFPVNNSQIDGAIELPDFLTEGNYILIASTNVSNSFPSEKMFSCIIAIKESPESEFITNLSLADTLYEPGSMLTAHIRFSEKENTPVAANFAYQLTGPSGIIADGKSKTDNEGNAVIKLQLPKFDEKESLKLLVIPSIKGSKTITGIVIPTRTNYIAVQTYSGKNIPVNRSGHLNIKLSTLRLQDRQDEKIQLEINVTDDKDKPVMANLSVSASNFYGNDFSPQNETIVNYMNRETESFASDTNQDMRKYFTHRLLQITQVPGKQFIVQEKNNSKKLHKRELSANQKKQEGYSSDRSIFDILMSIKPYHIDNGKITFGINSMNSINNLDGALIVVDGTKMGTDASILNNIPVADIARITASTNVMEIQKYSAMNNVGIIEIYTKKNSEYTHKQEDTAKANSNTLFWGPDVITDKSGHASVSFLNNKQTNEILITVECITSSGLSGASSIQYTGK
jgi:hypothetical protein